MSKSSYQSEESNSKVRIVTTIIGLAIAVGLFYLGGWSFEHAEWGFVGKGFGDGYIGIEMNDRTFWGITSSDRFFKFGWASWVCFLLGWFTFVAGANGFVNPEDW